MNYIYQGSSNPYLQEKKNKDLLSKNYGTFPEFINNIRDNNNNVNPLYPNVKNTNSNLNKYNINCNNDDDKNSKNVIST
jgi:hypothetical protein